MKTTGTDILKDNAQLKKMPFSTPDCYFEDLRHNLKTQQRENTRKNLGRGWELTAAMITLLLTAGTFFLARTGTDMDFTEEDYLVFSDDISTEVIYDSSQLYAYSESLTDEEIIQYLIDTGWEIEDIE